MNVSNKFLIQTHDSSFFENSFSGPLYYIFVFDGEGKIILDFTEYEYKSKNICFLSPYQIFQMINPTHSKVEQLGFHGDFYCIEYHKKEVSCNGLLFNNIYLFPYFTLKNETYEEVLSIFDKIKNTNTQETFSETVLTSYLQLILAICSREKSKILNEQNFQIKEKFSWIKDFQNLVEKYFLKEKSPSFYANLLNISPNTLSKKIKSELGKSPSQIIQDRVILEAKKQIHLTRKSIKEISSELNFEDEFYFSKYFKKHTGVSPTVFRSNVGISIVAEKHKKNSSIC